MPAESKYDSDEEEHKQAKDTGEDDDSEARFTKNVGEVSCLQGYRGGACAQRGLLTRSER